MSSDVQRNAGNIVRAVGGALASLSPLATGPWGVALAGIGAGVSFVGELIAHGLDPVVTIQEIQSVLPDYQAARQRLDDAINARTKRP